MRAALSLVVVAAALAGCGGSGFYRGEAEATCRERGLAPDSPGFVRCVDEIERHVYIWVDRDGY